MNRYNIFDLVNPLFQEVLNRSIKGAILILLIFALRGFFKNRVTPAWRHALWLLIPVLLFWPKFPASVCSIENWTGEPRQLVRRFVNENAVVSENSAQPSPQPLQTQPHVLSGRQTSSHAGEPIPAKPTASEIPVFHEPVPQKPAIPFSALFSGIWMTVLGFLTLRLVRQSLAFRKILREAVRVTRPDLSAILDDCRRRFGIRRNIDVLESPQTAGPAMAGLFRPVILLPPGLASSVEPSQLGHIFLHELAHWKRGDLWTGWLSSLTFLVHWFNPLVWFAIRKMNEDREEACDALALKKLGSPERADYGETLLLLAAQLADVKTFRIVPGAAGIMESKPLLSRRIERIASLRKYKRTAAVLCAVLILTLAAAFLTTGIRRDDGGKLFGIIPIPKKETPNPASVTFEKIPRQQGLDRERIRLLRGKFQTPHGEPLENASMAGIEFGEHFSSTMGAKINSDGTFTYKTCDNIEGVIFLQDKSEKWAARPYSFNTYDLTENELEITIPVHPAIPVTGRVTDKKTGKPLAGICLQYIFLYDQIHRARFNWTIYTDEHGEFHSTIPAGDSMFLLDSAASQFLSNEAEYNEEDHAVFERTVSLKEWQTEPVELSFELPEMFVGKLLNPDGSPAKRTNIHFANYYNTVQSLMSTYTNDDGIFYLHKAPEFAVMTVNSPDPYDWSPRERFHRWYEKELSAGLGELQTFQLQNAATIRARFLNAATGEPFDSFSLNLRCQKPGDPETKNNHSWAIHQEKTDVPGEFLFRRATPGVEYHFQGSFPGFNREIKPIVVTATESGQFLDLGDVVIEEKPAQYDSPRPKSVPVHLFGPDGREVKTFEYHIKTVFPSGTSQTSSTNQETPCVIHSYPAEEKMLLFSAHDPDNQWAVKPVGLLCGESWKQKTELRLNTEKGEMIRGTVTDESTGKPIPKMPLTLVQKYEPEPEERKFLSSGNGFLLWNLQTDEQGKFETRMASGRYGIGINDAYTRFGHYPPESRQRQTWTRSFRLDEGKPVRLELRIPAPFIGKVLTAGGKPAANTYVDLRGNRGSNLTLYANSEGEFRLFEVPPPYSYFTFTFRNDGAGSTRRTVQRLIRWVEPEEMKPGIPVRFRLSNIDAVGRLLDGKTGVPVPFPFGQQIQVSAEHPSSKKYRPAEFYFNESSEQEGGFRLQGLTPGVRYILRFGGEDCAVIVPDSEGNLINLGDVRLADGKE